MENNFFKSVIDADDAPVVICDLERSKDMKSVEERLLWAGP